MIQIIFATNPLFFSSHRQTPKFNHIGGLIVGMLTLTRKNVKLKTSLIEQVTEMLSAPLAACSNPLSSNFTTLIYNFVKKRNF